MKIHEEINEPAGRLVVPPGERATAVPPVRARRAAGHPGLTDCSRTVTHLFGESG
jgi:hypothetical protein